MPPTKAELAGELAKRLQELEKESATHREVTAFRIQTLEQQVSAQREVLDAAQRLLTAYEERIKVLEKSGDHPAKLAAVEERLKTLERGSDHPATLSAHDQRLKALEKGNDRLWQFAPIILATFALLVSIYSAFVKK